MDTLRQSYPNLLWFLPTLGDGRYLGTALGARRVNFNYLRQIAEAAEDLGYFGVLLPTGKGCEDSWIIASAVVPFTTRLKYLVAVRPGLQSPTLAARMTSTLDRVSQGRLLINVVTGGDHIENKGDGIFLSHDERYDLTREFLAAYNNLLVGETVSFRGKHIRVESSRLSFLPLQKPRPPLYFGGSSDAARDVAATAIDKYLTWGESPAQVAEKISAVPMLATAQKGVVTFGIRLHVIVRETEAEAWRAADKLIQHVGDSAITSAMSTFARMDSVGQKRMMELHEGRRDKLEVSPKSLGWNRPSSRRCWNGACRRSNNGGRANKRIYGARHRYFYHVRLSAPGGGLPFCGACFSQAFSTGGQPMKQCRHKRNNVARN